MPLATYFFITEWNELGGKKNETNNLIDMEKEGIVVLGSEWKKKTAKVNDEGEEQR